MKKIFALCAASFLFVACGGDSAASTDDDSGVSSSAGAFIFDDESSDSEDGEESSDSVDAPDSNFSDETEDSSDSDVTSSTTDASSSGEGETSSTAVTSSSSSAGESSSAMVIDPETTGIEGCTCAPASDPLYVLKPEIEGTLTYVVSGCKSSSPVKYAWCNAGGFCLPPSDQTVNYSLVGQDNFQIKMSVIAINETKDSLKFDCALLKEFKIVDKLPSSSSEAKSSSSSATSSSSANSSSSAKSSSSAESSSSSAALSSSSSSAKSSSSIKSITGCTCSTDSPDTVWVESMTETATVTYHLSGCKPSEGVLYTCPGVIEAESMDACSTISETVGVGKSAYPGITVSVGPREYASVYSQPKCKRVYVAKKDSNLKRIKPSGTYDCVTHNCVTTDYLNQSMLAGGKYGEVLDERDNKVYKTIEIPGIYKSNGEHRNFVWLAQNLDYYDPSITTSLDKSKSRCQGDSTENCEKYGRQYTWGAATDSIELAKIMGRPCGDTLYSVCKLDTRQIRGVCPEGFHIPNPTDFEAIENYVFNNAYTSNSTYAFKSVNGNWWHGKKASDYVTNETGFSLVATEFGHGSASEYWHSFTGVWTKKLNTNGKTAYTYELRTETSTEDALSSIAGGAIFDYACTEDHCNVKQEYRYLRCVLNWEY